MWRIWFEGHDCSTLGFKVTLPLTRRNIRRRSHGHPWKDVYTSSFQETTCKVVKQNLSVIGSQRSYRLWTPTTSLTEIVRNYTRSSNAANRTSAKMWKSKEIKLKDFLLKFWTNLNRQILNLKLWNQPVTVETTVQIASTVAPLAVSIEALNDGTR